jgi:sec-independent protein translocase protein TatA
MSIGFWQIAIVVILVVLLFGRGKISSLMGDVAKGIKSFKKGMATDSGDTIDSSDTSDSSDSSDTSDSTNDSQPKNITENNQDQDSDKKE